MSEVLSAATRAQLGAWLAAGQERDWIECSDEAQGSESDESGAWLKFTWVVKLRDGRGGDFMGGGESIDTALLAALAETKVGIDKLEPSDDASAPSSAIFDEIAVYIPRPMLPELLIQIAVRLKDTHEKDGFQLVFANALCHFGGAIAVEGGPEFEKRLRE